MLFRSAKMDLLKKKQLDAYGVNVRKQQDELVLQFLPAVRDIHI